MFKNIFTKKEDINLIREATNISKNILKELQDSTIEGISPNDINELSEELCSRNNAIPAFKGVSGPKGPFMGAICISVNDATLHGLPFSKIPFQSGDIVKLDFGIKFKGFLTDHCVTVGIGKLDSEEERLIKTSKLCIETAVQKATSRNHVEDISFALQSVCDLAGFNYITNYCGHGIGKELWLNPQVPSFGDAGKGPKLIEGMLLCVENQITLGSSKVKMDEDGWTIKTVDGSKSAMHEHMVLVGKDKPEILTKLD